jgi:hypothetical protein
MARSDRRRSLIGRERVCRGGALTRNAFVRQILKRVRRLANSAPHPALRCLTRSNSLIDTRSLIEGYVFGAGAEIHPLRAPTSKRTTVSTLTARLPREVTVGLKDGNRRKGEKGTCQRPEHPSPLHITARVGRWDGSRRRVDLTAWSRRRRRGSIRGTRGIVRRILSAAHNLVHGHHLLDKLRG